MPREFSTESGRSSSLNCDVVGQVDQNTLVMCPSGLRPHVNPTSGTWACYTYDGYFTDPSKVPSVNISIPNSPHLQTCWSSLSPNAFFDPGVGSIVTTWPGNDCRTKSCLLASNERIPFQGTDGKTYTCSQMPGESNLPCSSASSKF